MSANIRLAAQGPDAPKSGSGMDRVIEPKRMDKRLRLAIGASVLLALAAGGYALSPSGDAQTVEASRLTISTVAKGTFEDFLPVRGKVTPLVSVYLDAIEGGRVERVLVEDGATVAKGQLLAVLSNSELQLSVLAREAEVTEQLNIMRGQELALQRTRLENDRLLAEADWQTGVAKRQLDREAPLAAKGWVAGKTFRDTEANYKYQRERRELVARSRATDERLQSSQLAQLRESAKTLQANLALARANLDALNLKAPVAGQLTAFSIQVGQSLGRGERLGQIDSPGRNKLQASIDEFYLGRVEPGQKATAEWGGKSYAMKVAKIYPQVRDGQFQVDLHFTGDEPPQLQRGQTIQAKVTLGDPAPALLLPNGAFYNDTGGNWVFVVAPGGGEAVRREVRLGRRNTDFIEVLDGLEPGEHVVTSPYTGLADKQRLDIDTK